MNDAMTVCSQFIPDRERVANCLISNSTRVSEACRVALTHFDQSRSPPAAAVAAERPAGAPVNAVTRQFAGDVANQVGQDQSVGRRGHRQTSGRSTDQLGHRQFAAAPRAKSTKGNPVASRTSATR